MNSFSRRTALKALAAGSGNLLFSPGIFPVLASGAGDRPHPPRRIVFFLQNHGFDPRHSTPEGIDIQGTGAPTNESNNWEGSGTTLDRVEDVELRSHRLPRFIDPLEPYKHMMTIVHGLNGRHIGPNHGAPYGALGGFPKGETPRGETIDCALSRHLPALIPMLGIGLTHPRAPIGFGPSAWGANRPVPIVQNPMSLYNSIFGAIADGPSRDIFESETDLYDFLERDAAAFERQLPSTELDRYGQFHEGLRENVSRRRQLMAMRDRLVRYSPQLSDRIVRPAHDTVSWEGNVEIAIAALKAGVTNVATLSAGMCKPDGSWQGLGITIGSHELGHRNQMTEPAWLTLRRFNMELLVRFIDALSAEREGNGTMMDNTLIVYTSCHGEEHHARGHRWPFLLIGNLGGRIRTGRYIHYPVTARDSRTRHTRVRTVNALYTTLLRTVGVANDRFNPSPIESANEPAGPLAELLV